MSTYPAQAPAVSTLTPSETVLLHGDQFAHDGGPLSTNTTLPATGAKVAAAPLVQALVAAALLAGEYSGAFRLEVRDKKALFGLRTVRGLFVEAGPAPVPWPEPSLEAHLGRLLRGGPRDVSNLLYILLWRDSSNPWEAMIDVVKQGLAARGLLEIEDVKHLKVLTTQRFRLTPAAPGVIAAQPATFVQEMFTANAQQRPELWKLLNEGSKSGVKLREERDSSSSGGF